MVIAVYVGATGKDVPERKNALLGGRAPKKGPLLGGRALPTLYCFGHILRTFLHRFTTIGVGMGCSISHHDVIDIFRYLLTQFSFDSIVDMLTQSIISLFQPFITLAINLSLSLRSTWHD